MLLGVYLEIPDTHGQQIGGVAAHSFCASIWSMYGDVHVNHVLYKVDRTRGGALPTYRQIAVVEMERFQVRIFSGDVIQKDPKFIATNPDAEVYFYSTLQSAVDDAREEFKESVDTGHWLPYHPDTHAP